MNLRDLVFDGYLKEVPQPITLSLVVLHLIHSENFFLLILNEVRFKEMVPKNIQFTDQRDVLYEQPSPCLRETLLIGVYVQLRVQWCDLGLWSQRPLQLRFILNLWVLEVEIRIHTPLILHILEAELLQTTHVLHQHLKPFHLLLVGTQIYAMALHHHLHNGGVPQISSI